MIVNNILNTYRIRADRSDWRDQAYQPSLIPLKETVDMRQWASAIENQGHLGSCTGNAIVGVYELLLNRSNSREFVDLSRLFVYYNSRLIEGVTNEDIGAYVRDGIKSLDKYGVCSELLWPYDLNRFATTPSVTSYQDAKRRNIKDYYRLRGINDILDALNNDHPIVFSMLVYNAFEMLYQDSDYVLKMPSSSESPIGGHAMCFVGYDLNKRLLLARNSFGPAWCMGGYCWIPFDYVAKSIMDCWIFNIDLSA